MHLEQRFPSAPLSPFIKSFLFIESGEERNNIVLPDTSMTLALRYKGQVSTGQNGNLPTVVFSGIRESSRQIHYNAGTANLLINFRPGGAAAFFHEPLNELFGQSMPVDWLKNGSSLSFLGEALAELAGKSEQLALVEKMLIKKLIRQEPDPLVAAAIQSIHDTDGNHRIAMLAKELYISRDAFEKRFRHATGTSPKHFSSIVRLRKAIGNHVPGRSLTDLALTAGYYDQAHFIREFRAFTGRPPRQFFNEQNFW